MPTELLADNPEPEVEVSTDPAPEPVEIETEDTSDPDTPDTEEVTPEAPPKYTVKLNGREVEVDLDELRKGYMLQADYTAKRQAESARVKEIEAESKQRSEAMNTAIEAARAALAMDYNQANWDELARTDPATYVAKQHEMNARASRIQQAIQHKAQLDQQENQKRDKERQDELEREANALSEYIPEWKDDSKRVAEQQAIRNWAKDQGFSDDDLASITKASHVVTLRKAMLYDKLSAQIPKAKPAPAAPPPPPPAPTKAKAAPNPDKMTTDEWLKWRTAQIQKKKYVG